MAPINNSPSFGGLQCNHLRTRYEKALNDMVNDIKCAKRNR